MPASPPAPPPAIPIMPADLGTKRTIMAADRTLMAWIRTSLSMLSFGFTIYKFLETVSKSGGHDASNSPQQIGLFLAGMGTAAIILGTYGYWTTLRELQRESDFHLRRPILIMALVMCLAGIALFASIAFRVV